MDAEAIPRAKPTRRQTIWRALYNPFIAFVFAVALLLTFTVVAAATAPEARAQTVPNTVMDVGGLFIPAEDGTGVVPAPLLGSEIDVDITGIVARTRITHMFRNPAEVWTEAVYTHPLPSGSAVNDLRMRVGDRVIVGQIREKEIAARMYVRAKRAGHRASLVESQRPNLFTTAVANLGPGETVRVEISFQQRIDVNDGQFQLRMPLVVGPRYIPGGRILAGQRPTPFGTNGWAPDTERVSDASRITPPLRTEEDGVGNPVTLSVNLDAGFPVASLVSPSHKILANGVGGKRLTVRLDGDAIPANKDFVLSWKPATGATPQAGFFWEEVGGQKHGLLLVTPPQGDVFNNAPKPKREVIFILDTSGSMHGASLENAKDALNQALDRLTPEDTFQIFRFADDLMSFGPNPIPAGETNIDAAQRWVTSLVAEGGTDIVSALESALRLEQTNQRRLRQVVLITDGAVGNEEELLRSIDRHLSGARLFTVGIGSAPNGYLMRSAAAAGRGTFTFIPTASEVTARMNALFQKLERPALVDLSLAWPKGAKPTVWPNPLPDLHAGEPIVALMKANAGQDWPSRLRLAGLRDGALWETEIQISSGRGSAGVAALWARQKIASLRHKMRHAEAPNKVKAEIIETALSYNLVSAYTSLVAIDQAAGRPEGEKLISRDVPTNLPEGWSREHVSGETAPAPDATAPQPKAQPISVEKGEIRQFDRSSGVVNAALRTSGVPLASVPQGSTAAALFMLLGSLFVAFAGAILWFGSRKRRIV